MRWKDVGIQPLRKFDVCLVSMPLATANCLTRPGGMALPRCLARAELDKQCSSAFGNCRSKQSRLVGDNGFYVFMAYTVLRGPCEAHVIGRLVRGGRSESDV